MDSDNDGFTDALEIAANTSATDATSIPVPDFTETVGTVINDSGLDPVYHITYNESETNGNHHLALPNSTGTNTTYHMVSLLGKMIRLMGNLVKVMNFQVVTSGC